MGSYEDWKANKKSYLKLQIGEKYECIYRGKEWDPEGGIKKTGTMKYMLEDLKTHKVLEMSSGSQSLDDFTNRILEGDKILITVGKNSFGTKAYTTSLVEKTAGVDLTSKKDEDDEEDGEEEEEGEEGEEPKKKSKKVPF